MRAWRFHEFGSLDKYILEDVPLPEPADGEVLVKLSYAALNPADRLLIEGRYPGAGALPLTVGRDGSGTIEQAPEGSRFAKGDEVIILRSDVGITRQGTLAEYAAVPESVLAHLPKGWLLDAGAAAPLTYLTAWKALVVQGRLREGETVLVTGATGGVGIAAVQLAKALGANVLAMTRDPEKSAALMELGADHIVDGAEDAAFESVTQAAGGVDLIVEHLAGSRLNSHVAMCNLNGRIMLIGLLAGRTAPLELGPVLFKQVRIEGVHVGKFVPAQAQDAWRRIVETLDRADARPVVDKVYPMDQVHEAFERLAGGHLGKVLVDVNSL